jgi:minor extracellular serine protease Vpr
MRSDTPSTARAASRVRRSRPMLPRTGTRLVAAACLIALAGAAHAQISRAANPLLSPQRGGEVPAVMPGADQPTVRVIVQFVEPPVVDMRPNLDVTTADRSMMRAHSQRLQRAKAPRLAAIQRAGGRVQNTVEYVYNGAVVDIAPQAIAALRAIPGVKQVQLAGVFEMSQAAPPTIGELIGTLPVNVAGNGGQGVAIAVIDSGVDYTHASFDGPGTVEYYQAAIAGINPTIIGNTPGVFPDGPRVKGGYDWLGETWPNGPVTPDPDPIDNRQPGETGPGAGHGTNAASAAAGSAVPAGGLRAGSAPQAWILAYRGCARAASSCEGSALLNSIESIIQYAAGNPNGGQPGANNPTLPPGTRFVINMSLGAGYGNPLTNPLAEASRNAVRGGVTVVASAGNSNNIPFITGTPGATDMVISVAASQPAGLFGGRVDVGAPLNANYLALLAAYGPLPAAPLTAPLAFAGPNNTAGNTTNLACSATINQPNPGPASPAIPDITGRIGVADRGVCEFSEKTVNVQRAGGVAMLLVNSVAGTIAPGGGAAAPLVTIPTFSVTQVDGNAIKNALVTNPDMTATLTVAEVPNIVGGINVVDEISGFSSRGPTQNNHALKPDITAPGSSIFMASVGTGFRGGNSSGTSFSGPLTAGAAALVKSARPDFAPWEVKAALMNTTDLEVFTNKAAGTLAGLTRMGAGRLRADRAVGTGTIAYDSENINPVGAPYYNTALSFGPQAFTAAGQSSVSRTVVVRNLGTENKVYNISVSPRFADDLGRGMLFSASTPVLAVAPGATATFQVIGTATGTDLPTAGGLPLRLTNLDTCTTATATPSPVAECTNKFDALEQDGFVTIDGGPGDVVRVPYLMVPRQASNASLQRVGTVFTATNTGVANTAVNIFNLVGTQDAKDQPALVPGTGELPVDIKALGVRFVPNGLANPPAGQTGDVLEFAVTTWEPMDTLRSATFNIEIDTTGDGQPNFTVRNLNTTSNRNAVFVSTGTTGAPANGFLFADQPLSSTRAVLPVLASTMGITATSRIGIRMYSTNGFSTTFPFPVLDRLPDNNQFQYVQFDQLRVQTNERSFVLNSGATRQFKFTTYRANNAASPGDKGLLVIKSENPVATEAATVQLLP